MRNRQFDKMINRDAYAIGMAKLFSEEVAWRMDNLVGYRDSLEEAYKKVDISDARNAVYKNREKILRAGGIGMRKSRSSRLRKIVLVAGAVYVLNELGYLEPLKKRYRRAVLATIRSDSFKEQAKSTRPRVWPEDEENPLEVSDSVDNPGSNTP